MKGDTFWTGFHVFQGTNEVVLWISDLAEVKNVISNFAPEALPEFNSAYINLHVSRYTILPGALIMGWQTGVYIRNQATINDHILMAAGVALFITSAIFGGISTVQFYKSFDIYNSVLMNKLQLNNSDKVLLMIFPSFSYDAENKSFNFSTKLNF